MSAFLYIFRLKSGSLYAGTTMNLDQRLQEHREGRACRTTSLDPPFELVFSEQHTTLGEARKREDQIKRWTRAKKKALVSGDMESLRKLAKSREEQK